MADISKIKLPSGSEYNVKDSGAIRKNETGNTQQLRRPASLQGANDVTLDAKINTLRANRLAFLPADQIIIEKTTDGGTTWEDAGATDVTKRGLFSETREYINIPLLNGKKSPLCGLRFTITGMKYNVPSGTSETSKYSYWNSSYIKSTERYCQLKEMYFWVSVSGGSINAKVERATGASPNNWAVIFNDTAFNMTGYSGNDYLSFPQGVFGGGTTQTGNYWNYRITLMTDDVIPASPYDGYLQSIYEIRGYGDTWWIKPNEYMANDKLYTHDSLMNAQFPAYVTATQFNGPLNGNAATASLAVKSRALEGLDTRSTNQLPSWYITNYPFRMIKEFKTTSAIDVNDIIDSGAYCELITDVYYTDASGGLPIQLAISSNGKRAIRFATNQSTWGAWKDMSDAETVGGHSVLKDVPSDAKFTDTVTTATTTGSGNAVTAITASNGALTVTKGTTFLTSHQDISGKADKATTLSGYGITDAKISNGTITLGSNTITPLTSYTETDPVFSASAAHGISSSDITNWNYAYNGYSSLQWNNTSKEMRASKQGSMTTLFAQSDMAYDSSSNTSGFLTISDISTKAETPSITASTGTLQSATAYRQGNVVQLLISVRKTSATASGQDVFEGTINTTALRPKMITTGGTYYGSYALNATISTAGVITVKNADSRSLAAMTYNGNISFTYLVD